MSVAMGEDGVCVWGGGGGCEEGRKGQTQNNAIVSVFTLRKVVRKKETKKLYRFVPTIINAPLQKQKLRKE